MAVLQVCHRMHTNCWWVSPRETWNSSRQYALTRRKFCKLCQDHWSKLPPAENEYITFTVLRVRQGRTTCTKSCPYLLFELTGFIDETISLLLQLVNNLPLLLSFILIILDFFFQVPLRLLMELHQIYLLLSGTGSLEQVLQRTQNNDLCWKGNTATTMTKTCRYQSGLLTSQCYYPLSIFFSCNAWTSNLIKKKISNRAAK